jgi:hypothetical protein
MKFYFFAAVQKYNNFLVISYANIKKRKKEGKENIKD